MPAGLAGAMVGREGALRAGAGAERRWRGIVDEVVGLMKGECFFLGVCLSRES